MATLGAREEEEEVSWRGAVLLRSKSKAEEEEVCG